jgi:hypothetical protein
MTAQTGSGNLPRGTYFGPLDGAKYMQLTTFRRDSTPVATPVHVVVDGDTAYFRTWDTTGKAKRLRHTSDVRVAPATFRGRPLGPAIPAQAQLLAGAESDRAAGMLARKHPVLHGRLIPWYHRRRGWTTQQYRLTVPAEQRP